MKKTLLLTTLLILAAAPAFADRNVTGDFTGKTKCENGMKKAGFKDSNTTNVVFYTLNEISHAEQAMSWEDSSNGMDFDAREKKKTELRHVIKVLHDLDCDTQDNPAQSGNGVGAGAQNGTSNATANTNATNGTSRNGYNQAPPNQQ